MTTSEDIENEIHTINSGTYNYNNNSVTTDDTRTSITEPQQQSLTNPIMNEETNDLIKNKKIEKFFKRINLAAHFCVAFFVFVIIYLCLTKNEFVFFTWHPLLLAIGWAFLMSQAILVVAQHNVIASSLSKPLRIRLHWIFQAVGLILIVIGFIIVYINKNYLGKSHFTSWHGLLGLIGVISAIPTSIGGIAVLFNYNLRQFISPKLIKLIHILGGILTFVFGGLTLILSVYTKWFERRANDLIFILCLISVTVFTICVLVRPIVNFLSKIHHLIH